MKKMVLPLVGGLIIGGVLWFVTNDTPDIAPPRVTVENKKKKKPRVVTRQYRGMGKRLRNTEILRQIDEMNV